MACPFPRESVVSFWTAVAKRSDDTAFANGEAEKKNNYRHVKAAWRFASRRSPKYASKLAATLDFRLWILDV
jgi:hypothetical protein